MATGSSSAEGRAWADGPCCAAALPTSTAANARTLMKVRAAIPQPPTGQPELDQSATTSNRNSMRVRAADCTGNPAAAPAPYRDIKRVLVLPRNPAGEALIYEPVEPAPFAPCR